MGFWSFLFGENIRVEDEYFGSLKFVQLKKFDKSYFQGRRLFTPINKELELGIDGELPGPTIAQKEFYRQIEENYHTLIPGIQELITDQFRNWKPEFTIQDFTQEFWLVHLSIPAVEQKEQEPKWELAFETIHDQNHTFTVYMKGFLPDYVHIDG